MHKFALFVSTFSVAGLLAQQAPYTIPLKAYPVVQATPRNHATSSLIMEEMPLIAPLFIEDTGVSSELVVVNNSADKVGATVFVRSLKGVELASLHLALKPHEDRHLPLASLTSLSGSQPRYGSISVLPDKDMKGPSIAGQLLITDTSNGAPFYLDEELAMPDMQGSSILRGVTDEASGEPLLAVSNLSDQAQTVTVHCVNEDAKAITEPLTLAPFATSLTRACSGSSISNLAHFLSTSSSTSHGVTGIEIVGEGAGEISAFAFAPHMRDSETVLSSIPFNDPSIIHSPDIIFAGVPIGPQPTLPYGLYIPRISLSNFSAHPAHVTVSLAVTARSRLESSDGSPSVRTPQLISTITIPARQSREILLTGTESQSGLLNSLYVKSDLKPGELQGKVVSRSNGGLFEIELLGKDVLDFNNGGIHPWTAEGDAESHLILYNHSLISQKFDVAIFNGKALWDKMYHLDPSETLEISFNQLMADKVVDDRGNRLDPSLKNGVVNWMTPDNGNATGRLMVTSRSALMARNYSCGNFVIVCGGSFQDLGAFIAVQQAEGLYDITNLQFCDSYAPGQCYGNNQGGGAANFSSTTSAPNSIAFNTPGDVYSQGPVMKGMAAGRSVFNEEASANGCQVSGNGSASVQMPDHVSVIVDQEGYPASCPSTGIFVRQMNMQLVDASNSPITSSGYSIQEQYNNLSANSCGTGNAVPSTCAPTNAGATFTDTLAVSGKLCTSGIKASSGCGFTLTSVWSMCSNSLTNSIWNSPRITDSNRISVNGQATIYTNGTQLH